MNLSDLRAQTVTEIGKFCEIQDEDARICLEGRIDAVIDAMR